MTSIRFLCFFSMSCIFSMISLAQTKFYVGSSGIFPDRAGKVIAFKATNSRASDTVYFVDVATGAVTDRVADGSFGLEFKMMKAKVLNREKLLAKDLSASYYWTEGGYDLYIARTRDSIIARAWLPKAEVHSDNPRVFFKPDNPGIVLVAVRIQHQAGLYNMLDTTAGGVAKLLYKRDLSKADPQEWEKGHLQEAVISPGGQHVFTMPDGNMIDLVKGKKIWDYKYRETGASNVVFSEDGTRLAIQREDHSISIRDVQRGKELYRIPAPPKEMQGMKVEQVLPLADMQHCFVFYWNVDTGFAKVLLVKADGSYNEVAF